MITDDERTQMASRGRRAESAALRRQTPKMAQAAAEIAALHSARPTLDLLVGLFSQIPAMDQREIARLSAIGAAEIGRLVDAAADADGLVANLEDVAPPASPVHEPAENSNVGRPDEPVVSTKSEASNGDMPAHLDVVPSASQQATHERVQTFSPETTSETVLPKTQDMAPGGRSVSAAASLQQQRESIPESKPIAAPGPVAIMRQPTPGRPSIFPSNMGQAPKNNEKHD